MRVKWNRHLDGSSTRQTQDGPEGPLTADKRHSSSSPSIFRIFRRKKHRHRTDDNDKALDNGPPSLVTPAPSEADEDDCASISSVATCASQPASEVGHRDRTSSLFSSFRLSLPGSKRKKRRVTPTPEGPLLSNHPTEPENGRLSIPDLRRPDRLDPPSVQSALSTSSPSIRNAKEASDNFRCLGELRAQNAESLDKMKWPNSRCADTKLIKSVSFSDCQPSENSPNPSCSLFGDASIDNKLPQVVNGKPVVEEKKSLKNDLPSRSDDAPQASCESKLPSDGSSLFLLNSMKPPVIRNCHSHLNGERDMTADDHEISSETANNTYPSKCSANGTHMNGHPVSSIGEVFHDLASEIYNYTLPEENAFPKADVYLQSDRNKCSGNTNSSTVTAGVADFENYRNGYVNETVNDSLCREKKDAEIYAVHVKLKTSPELQHVELKNAIGIVAPSVCQWDLVSDKYDESACVEVVLPEEENSQGEEKENETFSTRDAEVSVHNDGVSSTFATKIADFSAVELYEQVNNNTTDFVDSVEQDINSFKKNKVSVSKTFRITYDGKSDAKTSLDSNDQDARVFCDNSDKQEFTSLSKHKNSVELNFESNRDSTSQHAESSLSSKFPEVSELIFPKNEPCEQGSSQNTVGDNSTPLTSQALFNTLTSVTSAPSEKYPTDIGNNKFFDEVSNTSFLDEEISDFQYLYSKYNEYIERRNNILLESEYSTLLECDTNVCTDSYEEELAKYRNRNSFLLSNCNRIESPSSDMTIWNSVNIPNLCHGLVGESPYSCSPYPEKQWVNYETGFQNLSCCGDFPLGNEPVHDAGTDEIQSSAIRGKNGYQERCPEAPSMSSRLEGLPTTVTACAFDLRRGIDTPGQSSPSVENKDGRSNIEDTLAEGPKTGDGKPPAMFSEVGMSVTNVFSKGDIEYPYDTETSPVYLCNEIRDSFCRNPVICDPLVYSGHDMTQDLEREVCLSDESNLSSGILSTQSEFTPALGFCKSQCKESAPENLTNGHTLGQKPAAQNEPAGYIKNGEVSKLMDHGKDIFRSENISYDTINTDRNSSLSYSETFDSEDVNRKSTLDTLMTKPKENDHLRSFNNCPVPYEPQFPQSNNSENLKINICNVHLDKHEFIDPETQLNRKSNKRNLAFNESKNVINKGKISMIPCRRKGSVDLKESEPPEFKKETYVPSLGKPLSALPIIKSKTFRRDMLPDKIGKKESPAIKSKDSYSKKCKISEDLISTDSASAIISKKSTKLLSENTDISNLSHTSTGYNTDSSYVTNLNCENIETAYNDSDKHQSREFVSSSVTECQLVCDHVPLQDSQDGSIIDSESDSSSQQLVTQISNYDNSLSHRRQSESAACSVSFTEKVTFRGRTESVTDFKSQCGVPNGKYFANGFHSEFESNHSDHVHDPNDQSTLENGLHSRCASLPAVMGQIQPFSALKDLPNYSQRINFRSSVSTKSRIPQKQSNARGAHHSTKPMRPPMWLSKAELTQEIQRLGNLCEARTKELNRLKMETRHVTIGFEAFAALFKYMVDDLNALSVPKLSQDLEKTLKQLELTKQDLAYYEKEVEELKAHHCQELNDLSNKLFEVYHSEVAELIAKHQEEMKHLKSDHQKQIENLSEAVNVTAEETKLQHEKLVASLENELITQREELQLFQEREIKDLEEKHAQGTKILQEHIEQLEKKCAELRQHSMSMEDAMRKDTDSKLQWVTSRKVDLEKEVESLKAVLEMKNKELHSIRVQNLEMEKQLEELPFAREKIKMLQARAEDLEALMVEKTKLERKLTTENQEMRDSFEKEAKVNRRLSMENEELQWRLRQAEHSIISGSFLEVAESPEESENAATSPSKSPAPQILSRSVFFTFMDKDDSSPHSPRSQYKKITPGFSANYKTSPGKATKSPPIPSPRKTKSHSEPPQPVGFSNTPRKVSKQPTNKNKGTQKRQRSGSDCGRPSTDNNDINFLSVTESMTSSVSSESSVFEHKERLLEEHKDQILASLEILREQRSSESATDDTIATSTMEKKWCSDDSQIICEPSNFEHEDMSRSAEFADPKTYYHMTFPVLKETGIVDCDTEDSGKVSSSGNSPLKEATPNTMHSMAKSNQIDKPDEKICITQSSKIISISSHEICTSSPVKNSNVETKTNVKPTHSEEGVHKTGNNDFSDSQDRWRTI